MLKKFIWIRSVEFTNQNLLKSYDMLMDKVSLQKGNVHVIQVISKNEMLSLLDKFLTLESYVQNKEQKLNKSMRAPKQHTGL